MKYWNMTIHKKVGKQNVFCCSCRLLCCASVTILHPWRAFLTCIPKKDEVVIDNSSFYRIIETISAVIHAFRYGLRWILIGQLGSS